MKYRMLGSTGLRVSVIGFGGIPIQNARPEVASQLLRTAQETGINFIDTARGYGSSEDRLGEALAKVGGNWIVASKSMRRDGEGFRLEIEQSLRSLRRKKLELYQFHNISSKEDIAQLLAPDGAYNAALQAKKEGLIDHIGISSHKADILAKVLQKKTFATIQIPFNAVESQFMEIIKEAKGKNIGIIVMKPLAGGAINQAQSALRYILEHDVTTVIPGMQRLGEVAQNAVVGINYRSLTDEERISLNKEAAKLGQEFCRRCEYCLPCPQGIGIPATFILDGYYNRYDLKDWAVKRYSYFKTKANACVDCKICEDRCPYDLPIVDMLKKAHTNMHR